MGTEMFSTYQPGSDVAVAFRAAVHDEIDSARAERRGIPHCSIFGKQDLGFVVEDHPPLALDDATALASKLVLDDCDGPAQALAVSGGEYTFADAQIPDREGGYPNLREAAEAAIGGLQPGETITGIDKPRPGFLTVTTTGSSRHTGWLFFGIARL